MWEEASVEVNEHVHERRALGSPGELMPGTLAGGSARHRGWGERSRGTTRLRYLCHRMAPSFYRCTSIVLTHRRSLKLVQEDEYLFPYYSSTSFLAIRLHAIKLFYETGCWSLLEWSWLYFSWKQGQHLRNAAAELLLLSFCAVQTVTTNIYGPNFRGVGAPFKQQQQQQVISAMTKKKCLLSQRS